MSGEEVQEVVEVEAPDDVVAEEVEEQPGQFEEDITEYGPDGPIQEGEEEVAEGEEEAESEDEAETPAEGPTAETPAPKQFEFRSHGRTIQVPGAVEVEVDIGEGQTQAQIVMTKEAFSRTIQPRFPDPEKTGQRERELEAQIENLNPDNNETVIRAGVFAGKLDGLTALAKEDPDAALQVLQNFEALANNWDLEAKNAVLEANANRQTTTTTSATEEAKVREWTGIINSEMGAESPTNIVDQMLTGIELPEADQQMLRDYVWNHRGDYYLEATAEHASQFEGISEGDLVRNNPRLIQDLEHQISLMQRAPVAKKAKRVEEANKKAVEGKKVPPTRSAKGKKGGAGSEHVPAKSKEEWRERMGLND